ncbi:MAG: flippase-like domain-containing protein [Anaerolineales bacterium]|nr:flippase-like domain-containing protein [Anaerolineales bacterium]
MDNASFLSRVWNFIRKPAVSLALRVVVSGLLLIYLIKLSAFKEIANAFSRIEPIYLLGIFLLYFFSVSLQVVRWQYLLRVWDVEQRFMVLFRSIMTGLFFNNFLPGSLGGDAFRLYSGRRDTGKVEAVAATIFYERILGYASLVTLGLIVLSIRFDLASDWLFWLLLGGVFFALIGVMAVSTLPAFGKWAENLVGHFRFAERLRLKDWVHSFRFKVNHPGMLAGVFLLSFIIQLADILIFRLVAASIQLPVKLTDLLLFVPLLYLAILLPLSFNGIGIRESIFVIFASTWGISSADAVAFSLTVFTLNLAGSLVGGIFYWSDRPTRKDDDMNKSGISG